MPRPGKEKEIQSPSKNNGQSEQRNGKQQKTRPYMKEMHPVSELTMRIDPQPFAREVRCAPSSSLVLPSRCYLFSFGETVDH